MLYKLTSVALLLFVNVNYISANGDHDTDVVIAKYLGGNAAVPRVLLGLDDAIDIDDIDIDDLEALEDKDDTGNNDADDTGENGDDTDDNTEDNDDTDTNDDTDDTDDTNDDDTDDNDSTDIRVTSVGSASGDNTESPDSADNTASGDDDDDSTSNTASGDSDDNSSQNTASGSGSNDGDDDSNSNASGNDSNASGDDSDEDECLGLTQSDCADEASADGDATCGFNTQTNECYSVTRRAGERGSGNFDDGYNAAKDVAAQESGELYTIVGVLCGIIGALVLMIGGAGYYVFNKNKAYDDTMELTRSGQTLSVNDDEELIQIRTTDNVTPIRIH